MFQTICSIFLNNWYLFLAIAVIAYLIGSINPAVIVTRVVTKGKGDIRQMGSGNAGFTNVLRSVGKTPAIITIVSDALKCVAAVLIGFFLFKAEPSPFLRIFHQEGRLARCFYNELEHFFCIIFARTAK